MREALAGALSRHFDQAQLREAVDSHARAVARQRLPEFGEHRVLVFVAVHVDEVDDNDAAQVAQPQLPRDRLRGFEIGFENGVVETSPRHERAGVHIDRDQRLGLVDDDVAAGF